MDEMARLVRACDVALWSVFFLVPVGRAAAADVLTATETEDVFADLYRLSRELPFPLKTTEAPHYRRFVAERGGAVPRGAMRYAGIGDGKGFVFISHVGDIAPSGFLPYVVGNVRKERLIDVYRDHPIMRRLRSPNDFTGKCGVCEYHDLCGGSRARAYTMTGDAFASEPTCAYIPEAARPAHA
jgi:radical SAM protein with 4Fe4S-binding SPASM domain